MNGILPRIRHKTSVIQKVLISKLSFLLFSDTVSIVITQNVIAQNVSQNLYAP